MRVRDRADSMPAKHGTTEIARSVRPRSSAPRSSGRAVTASRPITTRADRAIARTPLTLAPRPALPVPSGLRALSVGAGDPTQIVWSIIGKTATYRPNTASGSGTGLPTGWTEDSSDPANVQTNAEGDTSVGTLLFGSLDSANVAVWNEGLSGALDDGVSAWLQMGHDGIFLRAAADTTAIVIDNSDAPAVAMDAGGLPIQSVAEGVNPSDVATVSQIPSGGGGALTLLETVILEAPTPGSFDVSGIDQSYQDLVVICRIIGDGTADWDDLHLFLNGDTTLGNYKGNQGYTTGANNVSVYAATSVIGLFAADQFSSLRFEIEGYSTGGLWKQQALSQWGLITGASASQQGQNWWQWNDTDAVTEIALVPITYPLGVGSRMDIYGRGTK